MRDDEEDIVHNRTEWNNLRLINGEHQRRVEKYARIGEMEHIYNDGPEENFAAAGFFDDPEAPAVQWMAAQITNLALKNAFMRGFWRSDPDPEQVIAWLERAPRTLLICGYEGPNRVTPWHVLLQNILPSIFLSGSFDQTIRGVEALWDVSGLFNMRAQNFEWSDLAWVILHQYMDSNDEGLKQRAQEIWNRFSNRDRGFDLAIQTHSIEREDHAAYQNSRQRMAQPWSEYRAEQDRLILARQFLQAGNE